MSPYAGVYLNLFHKFPQYGRVGRHRKGIRSPWFEERVLSSWNRNRLQLDILFTGVKDLLPQVGPNL